MRKRIKINVKKNADVMFKDRKRSLRNKCKSEMAWRKNPIKLPIVVLERLIQSKNISSEEKITKTHKVDIIDDNHLHKNNNVMYKRLRNKIVNFKENCKKVQSPVNNEKKEETLQLSSNLAENKCISSPTVLLEKIKFENLKNNTHIKKEKISCSVSENVEFKVESTKKIQQSKRRKKTKKNILQHFPISGEQKSDKNKTSIIEKEISKSIVINQEVKKELIENQSKSQQIIINEMTNSSVINDECSSKSNERIKKENNFVQNNLGNNVLAVPKEISDTKFHSKKKEIRENNISSKTGQSTDSPAKKFNDESVDNNNRVDEKKCSSKVKEHVDSSVEKKSNNESTSNQEVINEKNNFIELHENVDFVTKTKSDYKLSSTETKIDEKNNTTELNKPLYSIEEGDDTADVIHIEVENGIIFKKSSKKNLTSHNIHNEPLIINSNENGADNIVDIENVVTSVNEININKNNEEKNVNSINNIKPASTSLIENEKAVSVEKAINKNNNIHISLDHVQTTEPNNISDKEQSNTNFEGLVNESKNLFINVKEACDKITADIGSFDTLMEMQETYSEDSEDQVHLTDIFSNSNLSDHEITVGDRDHNIIEESDNQISDEQMQVTDKATYTINDCEVINQSINSVPATDKNRNDDLQNSNSNQPNINNDSNNVILNESNLTKKIYVGSISCPKCRESGFNKYDFINHWKICRLNPFITCAFCTRKFMDKRNLVVHMLKVHNEKVKEVNTNKTPETTCLKTTCLKTTFPKTTDAGNASILEFRLPDFIKAYCKPCNIHFNAIPMTFHKRCEHCRQFLTLHCIHCNKTYKSWYKPDMKMHLNTECSHDQTLTFGCTGCNFATSKLTFLKDHVRHTHNVNDQTYHPCNICSRFFQRRNALANHKKYCGREAFSFCKFCKYKSKDPSFMKIHMQQHVLNNDQPIIREDEVKVIMSTVKEPLGGVSEAKKLQHEKNINSMISTKCPQCGNNAAQKSGFKYICVSCYAYHVFVCNICQISNPSHHHMHAHVSRLHGEKIYRCLKCNKPYSYEPDYAKHAILCGRPQVFKCDKCPYSSNRLYTLRQHQMRRHTEYSDYQFVCDRCSRRFSCREALNDHLRSCGVEPRIRCAHCEFKTKDKYGIIRHLQTRHSRELFAELDYVCNRCKKSFSNLFIYERHVVRCH